MPIYSCTTHTTCLQLFKSDLQPIQSARSRILQSQQDWDTAACCGSSEWNGSIRSGYSWSWLGWEKVRHSTCTKASASLVKSTSKSKYYHAIIIMWCSTPCELTWITVFCICLDFIKRLCLWCPSSIRRCLQPQLRCWEWSWHTWKRKKMLVDVMILAFVTVLCMKLNCSTVLISWMKYVHRTC